MQQPPIEYYQVTVNSRLRATGSHDNFEMTFALPLWHWHTVSVLGASIPHSYYLVDTNYDRFTITYSGYDSVVVILTHGNYSLEAFRIEVQSKLNSLATLTVWTCTTDSLDAPETGKLTIARSSGVVPEALDCDNTAMAESLGFERSSHNLFSGGSLTSTNVCKLIPEDVLVLHSSLVDNYDDASLHTFYMADSENFDVYTYQNPYPQLTVKPVVQQRTDKHHFYFTNENGEAIDFNGVNVTITLLFAGSRFRARA